VTGARSTAVALAALALALAGGALAVAQRSDGTVEGCVENAGGALRVPADGDACAPDETPLSWSRQGVTGPAGPPGMPGEQGQAAFPVPAEIVGAGSTGVSGRPVGFAVKPRKPSTRALSILKALGPVGEPTESFTTFETDVIDLPYADQGYSTAARLVLPAGAYSVTATAEAVPSIIAPTFAYCRLESASAADEQYSVNSLVLTAVVKLKKPGAVELRCFAVHEGVTTEHKLTSARITAVTVAKVHPQ